MAKTRNKKDTITLPPAPITPQPITETIEKNYMPYVMTVIVSRAIPEIDGFKPSHRKLLYTMYKMGLLTGARTKSTNIVGATMKLNPHGDAAIYETMVRLTRGNGALLHPFVDSKGNFGKQYSSDMAYAASRYTEAKLDTFCNEIFGGIDKNAVEMTDNYDATMKEPMLLPTAFPNVLVSPNMGIAVGMASKICSFNLGEICDGTVALLDNPDITTDELLEIIKAPDFSGGAGIVYDREKLRRIYETGEGSFTLRARYVYDKAENCIEVLEIPYSTTIELILKKITDMIKDGTLREVVDARNEIDLHGFKLTLDLRRGTDPEKLMAKLFKKTSLQDNFACNFNILVDGTPRTMGIKEILTEWVRFRMGCVSRELTFDMEKKQEKLHLLLGLGEILLDIDKAIRIVRETEKEKDVVPNLMAGFSLDEVQAEYIAEIKLRHLNREYIIERTSEIQNLQKEIDELCSILASEKKLKKYIAKQLKKIKDKYAIPRKTRLIFDEIEEYSEENQVENYGVRLVLTRDGFFKKITHGSLRASTMRGSDEQKLKEGDEVILEEDAENVDELLFITNKQKIYKSRVCEFDQVKTSSLGEFVPAKLDFEKDEKPVAMKALKKYEEGHNIVYIFACGKGVKIPVSSYETKGNRKKLVAAYSDASPLVAAIYESEPFDVLIGTKAGKGAIVNTKLIPLKTTRTSIGSTLITLKKDDEVEFALKDFAEKYPDTTGLRKTKIPAAPTSLKK
ncbi:MAG: topoisomerase IV [Clostridia bacterium]|nr:topoisomerase IV [Clostridia bacterium]